MQRAIVLLYHCLLFLYPPGFRAACGRELVETFADRLADVVARKSIVACLGLFARTVRDITRTAVAEWSDVLRHHREKSRRPHRSRVPALLVREAIFAWRMLGKNPGSSLTAIVTLAFGIALTTTMYSIGSGFLAPLPFHDAEQMVHVGTTTRASPGTRGLIAPEEFLAWREAQTSFTHLVAYRNRSTNVGRAGEPARRLEVTEATPRLFEALSVAPMLGRTLREGDSEVGPVTVISQAVWSDVMRNDSNAVGQTIRIGGVTHTIVGVMPEGFVFPVNSAAWTPLDLAVLTDVVGTGARSWERGVDVFGKKRRDVSVDAASQELGRLADGLILADAPNSTADRIEVSIQPFTHRYINDSASVLINLMSLATLAVLVIACFNVANLLLARAIARIGELALRSALGAGRRTIVTSLLMESMLLAAIGAVVGVMVAVIAVHGIDRAVRLATLPFWIGFELDARVVLVAIALTGLSGTVAGLLPALRVTRSDIHTVLQASSRGSAGLQISKLSHVLVIGEVCLSCALLLGGGFIGRSVIDVARADIRYETRNILTAQLALTGGAYDDMEARRELLRRLQERLAASPTVAAAAVSTQLPAMGRAGTAIRLEHSVPDAPANLPRTRELAISDKFLETFRLDVIQGEGFDAAAYRPGGGVVMINESFAADAFPGASPIGQRIKAVYETSESNWLTVVGVLPDLWIPGALVEQEGTWCLYRPLLASSHVVLSVRGSVPGAPLLQTIRTELAALDSDLAVTDVYTMSFMAHRHLLFYAAFGAAFIISGGVSLFLAVVGLYAVISFSVSRRVSEMGVRIALGATAWKVVGLVLEQGMRRVVVGLVVGTVLGAALATILATVMTSMNPSMASLNPLDPVVFAVILGLMLATGAAACFIPARRATGIDPVVAFRAE